MSRVVWLASALADLFEQTAYIASDNPAAARRVAKQIRQAAGALGFFRTGRIGKKSGTYEKVMTDLPYLIVYATQRSETGGELVLILRVIHTARLWPRTRAAKRMNSESTTNLPLHAGTHALY